MSLTLKEDDVCWCAADPGWITGHSYIVYGAADLGHDQLHVRRRARLSLSRPLVAGLSKSYGVTILYTAPTAIRGFMRLGEQWPDHADDLSSCAYSARSASRSTPKPGAGITSNIGKERCPIMDTWWQTETGGFMITPTPVVPLKPGSGTLPFAGY